MCIINVVRSNKNNLIVFIFNPKYIIIMKLLLILLYLQCVMAFDNENIYYPILSGLTIIILSLTPYYC